MPKETIPHQVGQLLLAFGIGLFLFLGIVLESNTIVSMSDFKGVYYGAQCALNHCDPYKEAELTRFYESRGGGGPNELTVLRRTVTLYVNLPTGLLFMLPFAILPWGPAHFLWMAVIGFGFSLAATLMWKLGARHAPIASGFLVLLFLLGSELLIEVSNTAGVVVSFCVIAVWCFLEERFVVAGIVLLAFSLAFKPHDGGLVWLFFLLKGGVYRKRALQTLLATVLIGLPGIAFMTYASPNWLPEMRANLAEISAHGGPNDEGPATIQPHSHSSSVTDLQSAVSVFKDDARFFKPVSYPMIAPLVIWWGVATVRTRPSRATTWLAIASISALLLLPIYHRQYDTRLLVLTIPACALLWAEGGIVGWLAVLLTAAGAVLTGDTPLFILGFFVGKLHLSTSTLGGQVLTVLLDRPAPVFTFLMAVFYLWAYLRRCSAEATAISAEAHGKAANLELQGSET